MIIVRASILLNGRQNFTTNTALRQEEENPDRETTTSVACLELEDLTLSIPLQVKLQAISSNLTALNARRHVGTDALDLDITFG